MEMNSPGRANKEILRRTPSEDPPFGKLFLISLNESLLSVGNDVFSSPIISRLYHHIAEGLAWAISGKVDDMFIDANDLIDDFMWIPAYNAHHGFLPTVSVIKYDVRHTLGFPYRPFRSPLQ